MKTLEFYSPEEEILHPLFTEKNIKVYLKRDDFIHPFISGNKWRKLKYLLLKAESEQKSHLVTFGGVWSNHLLATACAAAKFGFKSTGIVRGENLNTEVLMLCRLFGMKLRFEDRSSYLDKPALFKNLFSQDTTAFFIDEGGTGPEAALGCSEIITELQQHYDHIFCACGTGTTAAGVINGINKHNLTSLFHAVPVLKGNFIQTEINKLLEHPYSYQTHNEYHFGGYAKTKPILMNFITEFSSSTGILIEPVYTGKMIFALYDLIAKDHFKADSKILAIHTGGLFGLLGMKDKLWNNLDQ